MPGPTAVVILGLLDGNFHSLKYQIPLNCEWYYTATVLEMAQKIIKIFLTTLKVNYFMLNLKCDLWIECKMLDF